MSYAFQQCKNFENRLRFDKVTESLKVGTFLRHSVEPFNVVQRSTRNIAVPPVDLFGSFS